MVTLVSPFFVLFQDKYLLLKGLYAILAVVLYSAQIL